MTTHSRNALFYAVAMLTASLGNVQAQAPAPRPAQPAQQQPMVRAPQNEEPQQTTATYGDWVVQCVANNSPPHNETCDMAQVTQLQGRNVPFSRVAVTHPDRATVQLVIQVPVNASFGMPVRIQTSDADPGIAAPFSNCTPGGCFAIIDIKEDVLKKMREAHNAGKLAFADAGGHAVTVPISFNGFGAALDALLKK